MTHPRVYLAGPITGRTLEEAAGWREEARQLLWKGGSIVGISPLRYKKLFIAEGVLSADQSTYRQSPLTTASGITGRDRYDVHRCDLMIANLLGARTKTTGTAIEFGWADAWRIPIILVMEPAGNPADHQMLRRLAEFHVETLGDACALACQILLPRFSE